MDGVYEVEFENMEGLLSPCGAVVLEAGHFEGGTAGYHYVGTFNLEAQNRFRAEGLILRLDSGIQKCFGLFGGEDSELSVIFVGRLEDEAIRGLVTRLDKPYTTIRFRLTPKPDRIDVQP
jgi:hypothetical protein